MTSSWKAMAHKMLLFCRNVLSDWSLHNFISLFMVDLIDWFGWYQWNRADVGLKQPTEMWFSCQCGESISLNTTGLFSQFSVSSLEYVLYCTYALKTRINEHALNTVIKLIASTRKWMLRFCLHYMYLYVVFYVDVGVIISFIICI